MRQQQSAGLVLFRTENAQKLYLLLNYTNGGHWDFPKGKMELQETKTEAALRELAEETGITTCVLIADAPCHQQSGTSPYFEETVSYVFTDFDGQPTEKTIFFFLARTESSFLTLSHEHTDAVWLAYEQALKMLTYPNAREILNKAHAFLTKNSI